MRIDRPRTGVRPQQPASVPGAADSLQGSTPVTPATGGEPTGPAAASPDVRLETDPRVRELKAGIQGLDPNGDQARTVVAEHLIQLAMGKHLEDKPFLKNEIKESVRGQVMDDPTLSEILARITARLAQS